MKKKPAMRRPAKVKHEMMEGRKERMAEYGTAKKKKINALDKAIMKQKPLKSKNKNPGRYLDK